MKIAIVFYSLSGNTKYVALKIADKLNADLVEIIPEKEYPNSGLKKFYYGGKSAVMGEMPTLKKYDFNIDNYDYIILGTPVWAGTFTPPIRTFINENKENLKSKILSAFVCYSGAGATKALLKMKDYLGIENFEFELTLIDPKDKMKNEDEEKIESFCKSLKEAKK